jgi:predicted permease
VWRAVRLTFRDWHRNRLFALGILALLSIGIGANTLVFSFADTLLLKQLPVSDPPTLLLIEKTRRKQVRPDTSFFYRQFEAIEKLQSVFTAAVAEQEWSDLSFQRFSAGDSTQLITGQIVSPNYFSELGIRATAGRVLTGADAAAGGNIPIVLSYQFWRSRFGARQDAIGRTVRIHDYPFTVAGILPEDFHSFDVDRAPDVRFPIPAASILYGGTVEDPRGEHPIQFTVIARRNPRAPLAMAKSLVLDTVQPMEPRLWSGWWTRVSPPFPAESLRERIAYEQDYRIDLQSASQGVSRLRDLFANSVRLLMGGVLFLMLGVCATVGGLFFARTQARKRELAIRLAMGASRTSLIRLMLGEQLWLALPSALLGIVFAYAAAPILIRMLPAPRGFIQFAATPQILRLQLDTHAFLFASGLSILSVIAFGLAPFWRATSLNLSETLKSGSYHHTSHSKQTRGSITIAVAIAIIMVTMSIAMLRTFWKLEHINPGFDRAHVVEFTINPELAGHSIQEAGIFRRELRRRIEQLPGVQSVSYANMGIMRGIGTKTTVVPVGQVLPERTFLNTNTNTVSPEYFATLHIPLLAGRNLDSGDEGKQPARVVVNRAFAKQFFPRDGNEVVGRSVVQGTDGRKSPTAIIVGLVGTAKYRSLREVDPPIYYAVCNDSDAGQFLYVRTAGDPAGMIGSVRTVLRHLDPRVPLVEGFTLEDEVQNSLWQERIVTSLSVFFGALALVLAGTGMYAALAYSVERRRRELAIRTAVGAEAWDVVSTVCARIVNPVGAGLILGILGSSLLLHIAQGLLFEAERFDPFSITIACCVLTAAAVFAAGPPVLRAVRVSPALTLREP